MRYRSLRPTIHEEGASLSTMETIYILTGVGALLATVYYYLKSSYTYWERQNLPTIRGTLPVVGNIAPVVLMKKNFANLFRDFYNQTPNHSMVGFYTMGQPGLLVKDPELVKSVLQVNFAKFMDNNVHADPELDPLMVANTFFLKGECWKITRKQMSPGFSSNKLKSLCINVDSVCDKLSNFLKRITEKGDDIEIETKALSSRFTVEISTSAFGVEAGALEGQEEGPFREMSKLTFDPTYTKGLQQLLVLFFPFLAKLFKLSFMPRKAQTFFKEVVGDVLKYREKNGIQGNDFLQMLINLKKSETKDHIFGREFDEDTITAHAFALYLDMYETLSLGLSFLNYHLAKYPEVQQRVREEVQEVLEKHERVTYDAVQEMPYLDKVIQESTRMNPILGALGKVCTEETDLEGSDGLKCHVTPGTTIIISVFGLHMDPQYWPDPEKFDPERFSEENKRDRPKFVWLPFSEGPRVCVGRKMAFLLMKAYTATLLKNYTMEVSPRTREPLRLDPNYFLSTVVGGMWIKIKRL